MVFSIPSKPFLWTSPSDVPDVIGRLAELGEVQTKHIRGYANQVMEIVLEDLEQHLQKTSNCGDSSNVSCKDMGELSWEDCNITISTSYNATRVETGVLVPQIQAYKDR
ncbi:L-seryl-tRNA(Sec) selenium transferase [Striga asiatica]|uniref:L-seryl-tRNA(Sec) selenium transferase n=1 Tax=Striga asiatica TaxID=4170 RepID=A0A5A7PB32_STRAF|nr:L-seryl-tRNA(Sec) selenium transferase [Striga asiatica]